MADLRSAIADAIRQRVFSGLHLGLLKPGSRLPSARDLATEFGADRRVVLAAYREIEAEGLVEVRQRSGIYVAAPGTLAGATSRRSRWVVDFLVQGLGQGVPVPEVADLLHQCLHRLRLRAVGVECNDDQIASLCTELRTDYGLETSAAEVDALAAGEPPLEARRADILVTTRFHARVVKEAAERLGKPWLAVSMRTDMPAAIARLLLEGPVYVVVNDPRFAVKLGELFQASPGAANLRVFVVGRDAVDHIPDGAPTYLTGRAREQLGDSPLLARGTPEPREFSAQSATDLLTFIVRANMAALASGGP